jgi:hypothetical protein
LAGALAFRAVTRLCTGCYFYMIRVPTIIHTSPTAFAEEVMELDDPGDNCPRCRCGRSARALVDPNDKGDREAPHSPAARTALRNQQGMRRYQSAAAPQTRRQQAAAPCSAIRCMSVILVLYFLMTARIGRPRITGLSGFGGPVARRFDAPLSTMYPFNMFTPRVTCGSWSFSFPRKRQTCREAGAQSHGSALVLRG